MVTTDPKDQTAYTIGLEYFALWLGFLQIQHWEKLVCRIEEPIVPLMSLLLQTDYWKI